VKTWKKEALFVTLVLFGTTVIFHSKPIEYIGSLAVLFTFMHAQVSFRFSEAAKNQMPVECHNWSTRYFVIKEILWFIYFTMLGAWSALIGVFVFILYPIWRNYRHLADALFSGSIQKYEQVLKKGPIYNKYADSADYRIVDEGYYACVVDEFFTLYKSVIDDRPIGFQITNMKAFLENKCQ
jgi:hypothetical protein